MNNSPMWKLRLTYLLLVPLVIAIAFGTRLGAPWIPRFIVDYGGDTLWAWMVFMVVRLIAPRWAIWKSAAFTLVGSYLVEIGQLYHAPWIDTIRSSRLGVILFGNSFVWSDIICYTVGVLAGALGEWGVRKQFSKFDAETTDTQKKPTKALTPGPSPKGRGEF